MKRKISIGDKFGRLTIIKGDCSKIYGGRVVAFFLCACECGREESVASTQLFAKTRDGRIRIDRCSVCRRKPCVVCGNAITGEKRENVCGDICRTIKRRNTFNSHYAKLVSENPEHNKIKYSQLLERMSKNPEYAEKVRQWNRDSKKRYRENPDTREKMLEYQKERYEKNKAEIQAQRKRFFESLSIEEQEIQRERNRAYGRENKRKFREWLRENPSEHEAYIYRIREWRNEAERQKELSKMRSVIEFLQQDKGEK